MPKRNNNKKLLREFYDEMFDLLMQAERRPQTATVTPKDWALTHPKALKCGSDHFYANLVNTIQHKLDQRRFEADIPDYCLYECARAFAAYLEDLVSELGVWSVVRDMYRERYGKYLPFYDCDHGDYYTDDLNIEDLKVLAWQVFNRLGHLDERIFSPLSQGIEVVARIGYDILVDSFEKAPVATRVHEYIGQMFKTNDFYAIRSLGLWLSADNPLTAVLNMREEILDDAETLANHSSGMNIDFPQAYYYCEASKSFLDNVSMLGCPTATILEKLALYYHCDEAARLIATICTLPVAKFNVERFESDRIILVDKIGEKFPFDINSPGTTVNPAETRSAVIQLVKFGELWQQNGMGIFLPVPIEWTDADITIGNQSGRRDYMLNLIKKHKGRRVFYCRNFEAVCKITGIKFSEDLARAFDGAHNILLLLSEYAEPVLEMDACHLFSDRSNPFYDSGMDRDFLADESLLMIVSGRIQDDVALYIQEHKLLPHACINASQGRRVGKNIIQDNLRFLCGFYRSMRHHQGAGEDEE